MDKTISWKGKQNRPMTEDLKLVMAAQRNPAEFEHLYLKWLKPVYRYFYFRLGNIKDAEDLTSQVFLKVYKDLPRYRSKGSFAAWLFSIAHARLVDHYRRDNHKSKREITLDKLEIPCNAPGPLSLAIRKKEIERLVLIMKDLKEREQNLLSLRFMAELSFQEIGQVLHCKEGHCQESHRPFVKKGKSKNGE